MVTIYDIAKSCGIAPSTVSKALNKYKGVNAKTLAKVNACVKEMGYIPNATATNLITKRSHNIGVLISIPTEVGLNHSLFMSILNSFKTVLEENRYDITFISKAYEQNCLFHCRSRGFDGILLLGDFSSDQVQEVIASNLPVVCFDYHNDCAQGVSSNNYDCTFKLTQHLLTLNHRFIVYIEGEYNYVTECRRAAFLKAMADEGYEDGYSVERGSYYSIDDMYKTVSQILIDKPNTTAIMFPDDHSAIGGMKAILDAGLRIPEDISITGYDGIELADIVIPHLTTIRQNTDMLGKKLAELLLIQIGGGGITGNGEIVDAQLIIGKSTAQARGKKNI